MQGDKPLAFYSRTLNAAQKLCTTGEKELLSIVETLEEFCALLFGQQIVVHTDHKNVFYSNLQNNHIIRWQLSLEECGAECVHIAGKDNTVADALAHLDKAENTLEQAVNSLEAGSHMSDELTAMLIAEVLNSETVNCGACGIIPLLGTMSLIHSFFENPSLTEGNAQKFWLILIQVTSAAKLILGRPCF